MTREQVHDLMENELRCVQRGNYCDRDCAKCPLVKDDKELIEAYGYVIKALEQEPILDKIREQMKSHLRGVEIALEVLVENDPLRPKMEGAKDTLEDCLEIIDRAESEE